MKNTIRLLAIGTFALAAAVGTAVAHVKVTPADGKAGDTEIYTISIPTEGKIATVRTELVLPKGVVLKSVDEEGKPYEVQHPADGTTIIVWRTEIPTGWAKLFHFTVTNPAAGTEIVWKAHQFFADGSVADWADAPGTKRPASVTKLHS